MQRIQIEIPEGVQLKTGNGLCTLSGNLGSISIPLDEHIKYTNTSTYLLLEYDISYKVIAGTQKAVLSNAIRGISVGHFMRLHIVGVGYRAAIEDNNLVLRLGYTNPISFSIPEGLSIQCPKPSLISILGIDKQQVNQVGRQIRDFRKPEPYKGKGILYENEIIKRKEGKRQ